MEKEKITIIGGGPAGLFCAYHLLERGYAVDLYEQMSGLGKKFLVAGNGGLNLTHSEDINDFSKRYGKDEKYFADLLKGFSPQDLRLWCESIGVKTFVGSSGRIFPEKLNAAEILLNWIDKLKSYKAFRLFLKHRLINLSDEGVLTFSTEEKVFDVQGKTLIFALGGASWGKTGSDGKWKSLFEKCNIKLKPFLPMNCGFERQWSDYFVKKNDYHPLKNIVIKFNELSVRGEVMLTPFGLEGGGIYALSNHIRDEVLKQGQAEIILDLKPDWQEEFLLEKLNLKKPKESMSNHFRKSLNLDKIVLTLLKELLTPEELEENQLLAKKIKNCKIIVTNMRPISEAISTSGGVCFSELTTNLEIKQRPGIYIIGEMLDFEAPTGGYLLQGCFSTAWRVVQSICSKA